MRIMRNVCWLALLAGTLLVGVKAASAQSQAAIQACTPDAMRLCSQFIPDRAQVRSCMLRKVGELSEACRSAMHGGGRTTGARGVYRRRVYHPRLYHPRVYHRPVRRIIHRRYKYHPPRRRP
ncbi:MAG: hypothetical protein WBF58_18860 [Xanthobacteraceae bacterium]